MSKSHKHTDATSLREAADKAVTTWRELAADAKAKQAEYDEYVRAHPSRSTRMTEPSSPLLYEHTSRAIPVLESLERAEKAERLAADALDKAEVSEGDEFALARDPKTLLADCDELNAEQTVLQEKLADVVRRKHARVEQATSADLPAAQRRRAADLPLSTALPRFAPMIPGAEAAFFQILTNRVENGEPAPDRSAEIARLRASVRQIASDLEERRRATEAEERAKEEDRRWRAAQDDRDRKAVAARSKAIQDERAKDKQRGDDLAAAYAARVAGGRS